MLGGGEPAKSHVWLWPQLNAAVHVLICADGYVLGGGEAVGSHVWLGLQLNAAGYEVFYANGYLVASYDGIRRILYRHTRCGTAAATPHASRSRSSTITGLVARCGSALRRK